MLFLCGDFGKRVFAVKDGVVVSSRGGHNGALQVAGDALNRAQVIGVLRLHFYGARVLNSELDADVNVILGGHLKGTAG